MHMAWWKFLLVELSCVIVTVPLQMLVGVMVLLTIVLSGPALLVSVISWLCGAGGFMQVSAKLRQPIYCHLVWPRMLG